MDTFIFSVVCTLLVKGIVELTIGQSICLWLLFLIFIWLIWGVANSVSDLKETLEDMQKRLEKIREHQIGNEETWFDSDDYET